MKPWLGSPARTCAPSPARLEDFRWWAGVPKGRATAALATVDTVEPENGHLLLAKDLEAFEKAEGPDPDAVDVLPKWDCYTMGYAADGRERFVHPDVQDRVYTPSGDGLGVAIRREGYGDQTGHVRAARRAVEESHRGPFR
jgi:hypothetical protein